MGYLGQVGTFSTKRAEEVLLGSWRSLNALIGRGTESTDESQEQNMSENSNVAFF